MAETPKQEGKRSTDLLLDLYSNLLMQVWEIVAALIGESILELLFTHAVLQLKSKYPFLADLSVSGEGVSLEKVREAARDFSPLDFHRGFQGLVTYLLDLFSAFSDGVIGRELFPKVFPKVREAERIISRR